MSEKGGISLFRWLVRGLWFLVRVIVFLATSTWLGAKDERAASQPRAGTFTARKSQPASSRSLRTADVVEASERAVRRAERLQSLGLQLTAGDGLVRWLDDAVIAPLRHAHARAKAGDARALLELARSLPAYEAALNLVVRALESRRNAQAAQVLADLEEFAGALAEPIRALDGEGLVRVRQRRFVASAAAQAGELEATRAGELVIPLLVSADTATDPRRWPLLGHEVARALLHDVTGWLDELRGLLGSSLPVRMPLLPTAANYAQLAEEATLGPWLPELMADVLATYMLGPSYASALSQDISSSNDLERASTAEADGRWLSSRAPARLRLWVALRTLEELGFGAEASTLRNKYELARSTAPLRIPSLDGSHFALDIEGVLDALDILVAAALQEPNVALGERSWLDVVGLGFRHGEQAEAKQAKAALARGAKVAAPARVLVAGASLALAERGASRETILAGLLRSIRGVDALELAQPVSAAPVRASGRAQLRDLVRDRAAVRDAIVLGAVFSPPKAMNRALSKR